VVGKPEYVDPANAAEDAKSNVPGKAWDDPMRFEQDHTHLACISASMGGIIVAGMLYPAALFFVVLFSQLPSITGPIELLFGFGMVLVFGGCVGAFLSTITGAISICIVYLMNWSLGYPLDEHSAVLSAGSMAGYMPTVFVVFTSSQYGSITDVAIVGALGPLLAMCMGAVGAVWGAKKWSGFDLSKATNRKHKLSVTHLLVATTWVAVTFAIANAFGGPEFGIAAAGWFALQAIMLLLVKSFSRKS